MTGDPVASDDPPRRTSRIQEATDRGYRALFDRLPVASVDVDTDGRLLAVNARAGALLGRAPAEVIGQRFEAFVTPEHAEDWRSHLEAVVRDGAATGEVELVGEAERIRVRLEAVALLDGAGAARGARLVLDDLTEAGGAHGRAVAALRDSERRFRQIAEHVCDVYLVHERGSRDVTYVSPVFEQVFGRPVHELIRHDGDWLRWVHPADRPRVVTAYDGLFAGARFDETFRIEQPDGGVRWLHARMFPVEEADGSVVRDIGVFEDISEVLGLERALRQARTMEAVGTLANGVAHDFGNVLQGILGCLVLARDPNLDRQAVGEWLDEAAATTRRGGELVAHLVRMTRRGDDVRRPITIDAFLADLVPLLGRLVGDQVRVSFAPSSGDAAILGDPARIEQILIALASNAREAMAWGGELALSTARVELERPLVVHGGVVAAGSHVRLQVRDTGVGMDGPTLERAFDPFFTTKEAGAGLGLATVMSDVTQLGGSVDVSSTLGEGTTFTFWFPCAAGAVESVSEPAPTKGLRGSVLLVEDDDLVRRTLQPSLQALGLEVLAAPTGTDGMMLLEGADALELLIADAGLPGMGGAALAARLRERWPDLPVVLLTGSPDLVSPELPASAVLLKPFEPLELEARVLELLR